MLLEFQSFQLFQVLSEQEPIVPTDVPIDIEMKLPIINNPATKRFGGNTDKLKFTVESTPPIAFATLPNAPANKNITNIRTILGSPAPLQNIYPVLVFQTFHFY